MSASRAPAMSLDDFRAKAQAGESLPSDVILRKDYTADRVRAEVSDSGIRRATFTISTGAVDRAGDTIAVDGWDVSNFLKNPVVPWAHQYDQPPVAKAVSIVKTGGALKATAEFPPPGVYPLADLIFWQLQNGHLNATSVGFKPKKSVHNEDRPGYAMDFLEQELLEFSIVSVPCNPEALMDQAKGFAAALAAGQDLGPIEKALALARHVVKDVAPPTAAAVVQDPPAAPAQPQPAPAVFAQEVSVSAPSQVDPASLAKAIANLMEKNGVGSIGDLVSLKTGLKDAYGACQTASEHHAKAMTHLKELIDQIGEDDNDDPDDDGDEGKTTPTPAPVPVTATPTKTEEPHVLTADERNALIDAAVSRAVVSAGATRPGKE